MAHSKPLAADIRNNYFFVDHRRLVVDEGFIERERYDLPPLIAWIKANGVDQLNPLKCYKRKEEYVVIRGHRRRKAIFQIAEQTGEILMVPIFLEKKGASAERRYFEQATENDTLPYSPWEKAKVLRNMRKFGWSVEKMVEESGWSITYVKELLSLADAPERLIQLIRKDIITGTFAIETIKNGAAEVELLIAKGEAAQSKLPAIEQDLFGDNPVTPKHHRVTQSDIRPNSWRKFVKWKPSVEVKEMSPEKAEFYKFLLKLKEGKLTEKDFEKFFK